VRIAAIVLAAGASSRFGSQKLVASLGGRPVLQHVLDTLAAADVEDVVVVLGDRPGDVETALSWRGERRVVNVRPQDGLASSLRVGLDAAADDPAVEAILIVLGDQPTLRHGVVHDVIEAAGRTTVPFVRVRYSEDTAPNPVLVRRGAWALAAGLEGDRGLGPLLAEHPELVFEVPVAGANPDIDSPADLAAIQPPEASS
jgi:molybdenum cofactor cytidylyltransferase